MVVCVNPTFSKESREVGEETNDEASSKVPESELHATLQELAKDFKQNFQTRWSDMPQVKTYIVLISLVLFNISISTSASIKENSPDLLYFTRITQF